MISSQYEVIKTISVDLSLYAHITHYC